MYFYKYKRTSMYRRVEDDQKRKDCVKEVKARKGESSELTNDTGEWEKKIHYTDSK